MSSHQSADVSVAVAILANKEQMEKFERHSISESSDDTPMLFNLHVPHMRRSKVSAQFCTVYGGLHQMTPGRPAT